MNIVQCTERWTNLVHGQRLLPNAAKKRPHKGPHTPGAKYKPVSGSKEMSYSSIRPNLNPTERSPQTSLTLGRVGNKQTQGLVCVKAPKLKSNDSINAIRSHRCRVTSALQMRPCVAESRSGNRDQVYYYVCVCVIIFLARLLDICGIALYNSS